MEYPWAVPGRKVVCVRTEWLFFKGEVTPEIGKTYTIRNVQIYDNRICLRFEEIVNRQVYYTTGSDECCFRISCFKPIIKTNISVFTNMLKTKELENH